MTHQIGPTPARRGIIESMVHNPVTANLLMVFLICSGLFMTTRITKEVFPEFELDIVTVQVRYPGAGPEEIEQGIILPIEEALRGIEGIVEIQATATEGLGLITVELLVGDNYQRIQQDIKQAVDAIRTFPADAERPIVSMVKRRREVLDLQIYGDAPERVLRELAENVRDRLLGHDGISQVEIESARAYEIHVEISQHRLREYKLTLVQVAAAIRAGSVELPAGSIRTRGGEILLRTTDRRNWARDFASIPVITTTQGAVVRLGELATIREGFEQAERSATYNGKRSVGISVYRVGDETPVGVSRAVRKVMTEMEAQLPAGIDWAVNRDRSSIYRQRLDLLLKNAVMGLVLVMVLLSLFLEIRLAFWVTMGIPTSFLGAMLLLPFMGVSINMISMFAFIIALGIVVDDAIIAGENIYEYRQRGMSYIQAAVQGARDVAQPIAFSIMTNIVCFAPLYFVPGMQGKVWRVIPLVVITVFIMSWIESLVILPAHLGHMKEREPVGPWAWIVAGQRRFARGVDWFIHTLYRPVLDFTLRWRVVTVAVSVAMLITIYGYVFSGRIGMILMPRVESDTAAAMAVLPIGTAPKEVERVRDILVEKAQVVGAENGGKQLLRGVYAFVDDNKVRVFAYLTAPHVRPISTSRVTQLWREQVGQLAGVQALRFLSDFGGPGSGAGLTVELRHRDMRVLDKASEALANRLSEFPNVTDIDDGYTPGKEQLDFRLKPGGASLGLTSAEIARQVRSAFYGAEAVRQPRDRNEVKILVRRPEHERISEYDIATMMIRTPAGTRVPLSEVATVRRSRAYTAINRRDAKRTVTVTADVHPIGQTSQVMGTLNDSVLPELVRDFPGLSYGYEGRQAERRKSLRALIMGLALAMVITYFLLAIPFRSYFQPLIVMIAIPFGIVGAVTGHLLMGYDLSILSLMGIVALSGVVINDSLVLVEYANSQRAEGVSAEEAIRLAGLRRFRPVILTTLTTFGGLAPLIFETSRQARFMIPMALSLGFGIIFATAITLFLVPSLYALLDDIVRGVRRLAGGKTAT